MPGVDQPNEPGYDYVKMANKLEKIKNRIKNNALQSRADYDQLMEDREEQAWLERKLQESPSAAKIEQLQLEANNAQSSTENS